LHLDRVMRKLMLPIVLVAAPAFADPPARSDTPQQDAKVALHVTSTAFEGGAAIPIKYTCDGGEVSPPLAWSGVPASAKSIAVLVDDPDAPNGTFTHWLVVGIPPTTRSLAENATLPTGAAVAKNDKGTTGYAGPCPPSGVHHYHFHIYALDFNLEKSYTRADFLASIMNHAVATGDLVATYQKR
jgi:Raf kinase inhibitor-like YbhB/YbcL family protein